MKQKTFIIAAAIVVLLLLAAFVYLLFFNQKSPSDIFNDLGLAGEDDGGIVVAPPEPEVPVVNMQRPRLRQLTTKPVIGFAEVPASSQNPLLVRYAEAGTGHIYDINLDSGEEERISNTTIPEASTASFSPLGTWVAMRAENDRRAGPLTIGTFASSSSNLQTTKIDKQISDFKLISETELVYVSASSSGLVNTLLRLDTAEEDILFTVPFFEAAFMWGTHATATHYVYNRPSYMLEGYLYNFIGSNMNRVPVDGFGLTAFQTPSHIAYIEVENYKPIGRLYNKSSGLHFESPVLMLPEKCTYSTKDLSMAWCGAVGTSTELQVTLPLEFPDNWYRGITSFKDTIYQIDLLTLSATPLVDTFGESGKRELDIYNLTVGSSEANLYFINKNDNTLWMYEL